MMTPATMNVHELCVPNIEPWQWEESLNALRRQVAESVIRHHWKTTGVASIDATARAHIAEWQALDMGCAHGAPEGDEDTSRAFRALRGQTWDLFVVEKQVGEKMMVRRLRDNRSYQVVRVEGRSIPEQATTVALRLAQLDGEDRWASTLPVIFGDHVGDASPVLALLRSFGAHPVTTWQAFMAGPGARLILEYALSHLQERAQRGEHHDDRDATRLRSLHRAFERLESAAGGELSIHHEVVLDTGRIAWVEDQAAGPHLMVFDGPEALRSYRDGLSELPNPTRGGWCRVRRATPRELCPTDFARAAMAGLRPARDGMVRVLRRDRRGLRADLRPADRHAIRQACHLLAGSQWRRAA